MLTFDQHALTTRLDRIAPFCRVAFAASRAERLCPLYGLRQDAVKGGGRSVLRDALDRLWDHVTARRVGSGDSFIAEELIPGEDAEWHPLNPLAENAVAALAYAWRCEAAGDTQNAVWAAVQGYEAADYVAHTLRGLPFTGPDAEATLLAADEVQREIGGQLLDLSELEAVTPDPGPFGTLVHGIRDRSRAVGLGLAALVSGLPPGTRNADRPGPGS